MAVSPQPPEFPAIFRNAIVKGAQQALETVEGSDSIIQDLQSRSSVLHMLEFALELPEALDSALIIVEELSPQAEQAGFWREWVPYLEKGIAQGQVKQDEATEARLRLLLGVLLRQMGEYPDAKQHLECCIEQFEQQGDVAHQAKALNRLAFLNQLQTDYRLATKHADAALLLLAVDDTERAYSYLAKGTIAYAHADYSEAVDFFQRSVNIIEPMNDIRLTARHLRNLGPSLRALGSYDEAIACYHRTIELFDDAHDPIQKAQVQMNLGFAYYCAGQISNAVLQYKLAEPVFKRTCDRLHLAKLYVNMGIAYRSQEVWADSVSNFEASIQIWKELDIRKSLANSYDELSITYLAQGMSKRAHCYLQLAMTTLMQAADDPECIALMQVVKEHLQEVESILAD